jgi:hypothetical protein
MKKTNTGDITKPERPDKIYLTGLIKEIFSQRIAIIAMLLISLALCGVILYLLNRPTAIAVVNGETGYTSVTKTQNISLDVLEKQLLYYSREFCEDYFGRNHVTIRNNRQRAFNLMHPNMKQEAMKSFPAYDVDIALKELWGDKFEWKMTVVTEKSDPRYSVFCQFDVTYIRSGEQQLQHHNVKLDFGRLVKTADPFERPHSLVLLKVQEITGDELKRQLNLSY